MNTLQSINITYLRPSRTIETIKVCKEAASKTFYLYNYEGYSFRLFTTLSNLLHFFQDKTQEEFHFSTDKAVDIFLERVDF